MAFSYAERMASSETQASNNTQNDDLGIGRIAAENSLERFVNKDGSFNMSREGLGKFSSINPFYWLLDLTFPTFFGIIVAVFFGINVIFTGLYLLCGTDGLTTSIKSDTLENPIWRAFFFSVETLSTIGYGHIAPVNMAAHWVSTVQAFLGLLVAAIITGLLFARFSRPNNKILSSRNMLVAPFNGGWGLMCRFTNGLRNEIIELEASVTMARFETIAGKRQRMFYPLKLERRFVAFFTLGWTLVHPITPESPLWEKTQTDLIESQTEFLVVLQGLDDILYQKMHSRTSYVANEVVWNAKFADMYLKRPGPVAIDVRRLSEFEQLG
jgi:inward rectifier potassium channel